MGTGMLKTHNVRLLVLSALLMGLVLVMLPFGAAQTPTPQAIILTKPAK